MAADNAFREFNRRLFASCPAIIECIVPLALNPFLRIHFLFVFGHTSQRIPAPMGALPFNMLTNNFRIVRQTGRVVAANILHCGFVYFIFVFRSFWEVGLSLHWSLVNTGFKLCGPTFQRLKRNTRMTFAF